MFWQQLWVDYLAKTMPAVTVWSVPLVCLQMVCGLPPLFSLIHSVRRENGFDRAILCMVPGIFIVTAAIVQPLFFNSFLGEGFPWVAELRRFLFQPSFFGQSLALCAVFWLLCLWQKRREETRLEQNFSAGLFWAANGAELLAVLLLLMLATDYFLHGGGLFLAMPDWLVKWLIYGLFLVLYKVCVLLVCLLWWLLFCERPGRELSPAQKKASGWRAKGFGWLLFAGFWYLVVVEGLRQEGSSYGWARVVEVVLILLGVACMLFSLRQPKN